MHLRRNSRGVCRQIDRYIAGIGNPILPRIGTLFGLDCYNGSGKWRGRPKPYRRYEDSDRLRAQPFASFLLHEIDPIRPNIRTVRSCKRGLALTVIFQTNAGGPAMAGDMLISKKGPSGATDLRLPTRPMGISIPTGESPNFIPIRMRRKIILANDRMAIGASGPVSVLTPFVEALKAEFHERNNFQIAQVDEFLNRHRLTPAGRQFVQQCKALILVAAADWTGVLIHGTRGERWFTNKLFGRTVAVGTGAIAIIDQIRRLGSNYKYGFTQPLEGIREFPEFGVLAKNLTLLSNVYWKEFTSSNNLFDSWGGAYDLIYQDPNGRFRYLEEYTIFLRLLDVDHEAQGMQLCNVLKYERRPDVSLITTCDGEKMDFFPAKDITEPLVPTQIKVGGPDFTFNSSLHISIIGVGKGGRFGMPMVQIDGLDPAEKAKQTVFTQVDDDGRLCVLFQEAHDDWLMQQAMSYYQKNAQSWNRPPGPAPANL